MNSNLELTLGYLNPALNNSALVTLNTIGLINCFLILITVRFY